MINMHEQAPFDHWLCDGTTGHCGDQVGSGPEVFSEEAAVPALQLNLVEHAQVNVGEIVIVAVSVQIGHSGLSWLGSALFTDRAGLSHGKTSFLAPGQRPDRRRC